MINIELVTKALRVALNHNSTEQEIKKFFSISYEQVVNGIAINFEGFLQHLKVIKGETKELAIDVRSMVSEGDKVHTHHFAKAYKRDGSISVFEVFACFTIKDNMINHCEELTKLRSGIPSDNDLGYRC